MERLSVAAVLDRLDIRPDLNILDVGAGKGYLTFPIAKGLGGSGKVFATEIDARSVEFLSKRSRREGLRNVFPVLVAKDRFDSFYRRHQFDRVVVCHVFEYVYDPSSFFKELRRSLKSDTGRLFIIHPKPVSGFESYHFRDYEAIVKELKAAGGHFPVFFRLDNDLQSFIAHWTHDAVPDSYRAKIVGDFRRILEDPALFRDLSDYYHSTHGDAHILLKRLPINDLEIAKWLVIRLDAEGTFDKSFDKIRGAERARLLFLNQILLSAVFRKGVIRRYNVGNRAIPYLESSSIVSRMRTAGYALVREHDALHSHYFLEFRVSSSDKGL